MKTIRRHFLTLASGLLISQSHGFNLIIDSFDYAGTATSSTTFVDPSILGGESDIIYGAGTSASLVSPVTVAVGELIIGPATAVGTSNFGVFRLGYDGLEGDPALDFGLTSLDLSLASAIEVDVTAVTGSVFLGPVLYSGSQSDRLGPSVLTSVSGPGTVTFEFADLSTFGAFDITDVDAIRFEFQFSLGEAITLGEIRVVPEPGSAALCLLGISAAFLRRRRSF